MSFADTLVGKIRETSCLVLGIDPNFDLMPRELWPASPRRDDVAAALLRFAEAVIVAAHGLVPAVKFQSAYYEQFGLAGIEALAASIALARQQGLITILDAKRGDIGSTSSAYANAYLTGSVRLPDGQEVKGELGVDGLTVNPFLGEDSLQPFVDAASSSGKGLFILVRTSNAGSRMVMSLKADGEEVSERIARVVDQMGQRSRGQYGWSSVGAVVGATYPEEARRLRRLMPSAFFLMPGVGAQGGKVESALSCLGEDGLGVLVPVSRAATYPPAEEVAGKGYRAAVRDRLAGFARLLQPSRS